MDVAGGSRINIVHLSDWHLRGGETRAWELLEPLVRAVASSESRPSHLVVAITGDVAFSGKKEEYAVAEQIIGKISGDLERAVGVPVTVIIVPGNHDCNFDRDTAARKTLIKSVGPGIEWDLSIPATCTC